MTPRHTLRIAVVDHHPDEHAGLHAAFIACSLTVCRTWELFDQTPGTWDVLLVHANDYLKGPREVAELLCLAGGDPVSLPSRRAEAFRGRCARFRRLVLFSGGMPWPDFGSSQQFFDQALRAGGIEYLENLAAFEHWWAQLEPFEEARVSLLHALVEGNEEEARQAREKLEARDASLAAKAQPLIEGGDLVKLRKVLFAEDDA